MVTKYKLIYDLIGLSSGDRISDDKALDERQVGFWCDNVRATLLRQQKQKGQSQNEDIVQNIYCLQISQVDTSTCPCSTTDCVILRSNERLPLTIEGEYCNMITRVSSPNLLNTLIDPIPLARVPYSSFSKFGKDLPKYFMYDRYLWILSPIFLDTITFSGVFQYPEDLKSFTNCSGEPCYTNDSFYPISNHMIELMKKMIIEVDIKTLLTTSSDSKNDADDSTNEQKK